MEKIKEDIKEEINSIYVLLRTRQDDDTLKITCTWDFSKSGNIDERVLTTKHFEKIAIYDPDSKNPLFTALPNELRFTTQSLSHVLDYDPMSKLYKATNGYFTIGEILEAVRSFTEQEYNRVLSDKKYTFNDIFFTGITQLSPDVFELRRENTSQSMLGLLDTMGMIDMIDGANNNGTAFGQLMNMMLRR